MYSADTQESRLLSRLNAVRFLIVLAVAVGYASTMARGPEFQEYFALYGYDPSWLGIQALFFLSGLMAMRSVEQGRVGMTYLASRFFRNLPLLGVLTLVIILLFYPLFGTAVDNGIALMGRLTKYILLTTFCLKPGMPLEGIMENAKYVNMVQGGIWTLRYGVILHILIALSGRAGLLSRRRLVLWGAVFSVLAYGLTTFVAVKNEWTALTVPLTGLRLSYAFLIGMSVWAYRDIMAQIGRYKWGLPIILFVLVSVNFAYFYWSPSIEIGLALIWMSLSWDLLTTSLPAFNILRNWPNLILPMMVINWPVSQTLLLIHPDLKSWPLILLSVPITIILSLIVSLTWSKIRLFKALHLKGVFASKRHRPPEGRAENRQNS